MLYQIEIRVCECEDVLFEQEYIRDGSKKIKNIIPGGFTVTSYTRLSVK